MAKDYEAVLDLSKNLFTVLLSWENKKNVILLINYYITLKVTNFKFCLYLNDG